MVRNPHSPPGCWLRGSQKETLESLYLKGWSKALVQHLGPPWATGEYHYVRIWGAALLPCTSSLCRVPGGSGRARITHHSSARPTGHRTIHPLSQSRKGRNTWGKADFTSSVCSEGEEISSGYGPKTDQPGVREAMNNFIALLTLS